jgi:hypothetical protein
VSLDPKEILNSVLSRTIIEEAHKVTDALHAYGTLDGLRLKERDESRKTLLYVASRLMELEAVEAVNRVALRIAAQYDLEVLPFDLNPQFRGRKTVGCLQFISNLMRGANQRYGFMESWSRNPLLYEKAKAAYEYLIVEIVNQLVGLKDLIEEDMKCLAIQQGTSESS